MTPKPPLDRKRLSFSSAEEDVHHSVIEHNEAQIESQDIGIQDLQHLEDHDDSTEIQHDIIYTEPASIPQIKSPPKEETKVTENKPSVKTHVQGSLGVTSNQQSFNRVPASSKQIRNTIKQGEDKMAEVDTTQLSQEHGAIRHDLAVESARIGAQIGSESCMINKHIGDMRQEDAENFGHTRADIHAVSADERQENARNFADARYATATGFADTRRETAEGFGNARQEATRNFADTRFASASQAGDIRRELGLYAGEVVKEGLKGDFETIKGIKDARFDLSADVNNNADRLADRITEGQRQSADRFFALGRDMAGISQGQATLSKDIELNSLKGVIEAQKNTQYLADKIAIDGEKTRALINDHKYHDLNRSLVERNTELVNCEQDSHRYRDRYWDSRWDQNSNQFGAQFAAMQSQLQSMNQNFNSQLAETRQGLVNFGTMSGGAGQQTSTNNNVR